MGSYYSAKATKHERAIPDGVEILHEAQMSSVGKMKRLLAKEANS